MGSNGETKIVLTGGAGFIGSHILDGLIRLASGELDLCKEFEKHWGDHSRFSIVVIDNYLTGKPENLKDVLSIHEERISKYGLKVEIIEGDVCDTSLMEKVLKGASIVLHQAALPSVQKSVENPLASNTNNVDGTITLLDVARRCGVKRFVYASSSSVYGDTPELPKRENMPPKPQSPYAVSKLAAEFYCSVFYKIYGIETVSLRYFNVFGPRQDPTSQYAAVIPKFITHALGGKPLPVFGDGLQTRDFTFVENVVRANLRAIISPNIGGEVFNIATGARISLNQLIEYIAEFMGRENDLSVKYLPPRKGDIRHSQADITKAENLLNYKPSINFFDGLKITFEWFKSRI